MWHRLKKQGVENHARLSASAHELPAETVLQELGSDPEHGLSTAEALRRRERFGANSLRETGRQPLYRLFLHQFADPLIAVLFVAAVFRTSRRTKD